MIYYFSGTGNSRWAARQIAARLHDTAQDISKLRQLPDLTHESQIGLVFPIYAWGAPEPVLSFVKKLPKTQTFTFAVCTCGEEAGYAMKKLSDLYPFRNSYSLVMPNNYIIGADVDDAQTIRKRFKMHVKPFKPSPTRLLSIRPFTVYRKASMPDSNPVL